MLCNCKVAGNNIISINILSSLCHHPHHIIILIIIVTKLQVDYLVRARQLALTGHYPHLTDLHQVLDLDEADVDGDCGDDDDYTRWW